MVCIITDSSTHSGVYVVGTQVHTTYGNIKLCRSHRLQNQKVYFAIKNLRIIIKTITTKVRVNGNSLVIETGGGVISMCRLCM